VLTLEDAVRRPTLSAARIGLQDRGSCVGRRRISPYSIRRPCQTAPFERRISARKVSRG
jgi:hypothetical protein